MQKSKKISWQAIAIVVLALVLVAAIALGVSGAWFQDQDAESQEVEMGKAVLIRLADNTDGGPVKKWSEKYEGETLAYPGDFVLGATKILAATDTPSLYRAKIVTSITDAAGETVTPPAVAPTFTPADYADWTGTNPDGTVTYSAEEIAFNAYTIGQMLANTNNSDWIAGAGEGSEYVYYKTYSTASEIVLFGTGLTLSTDLTNACAGWTISVELTVEAIQAANISENDAWYDDLPTDVKTSANTYNSGREDAE